MKVRLGGGAGLLAALVPALDLVAAAATLSSGILLPDAWPLLLLLPGRTGFAQLPLPL